VPLTEPLEVASAAAQQAATESDASGTGVPPVSSPRASGPGQVDENHGPDAHATQQAPSVKSEIRTDDGANQSASARGPAPEPVVDPADGREPIRPQGITVTKADGTTAIANVKAGQSGPMALTDLADPPRQTVVISPGAVTVTTNPSVLPPVQAPASAGADSRPANPPPPASRPATAPAPTPIDEHSRIITAPMVQVNSRYISVDDVYRGAYERAEAVPTLMPKRDYVPAIKKIVQDELSIRIHDCLIIGEADKKLSEDEKKDIDKEMDDTLADMVTDAGTKAKLQERYIQRGFTLEDVLKDQRQHLTIRAYLRSHFSTELVVGRKMLYEYFTSHKGEFSSPLKVQMQIIASPIEAFLPKSAADAPSPADLKVAKEDARRNIELAAKALGEGKDFDKVAKACSKDAHAKDGGLWPIMPRGSLKETKLEDAAFDQKEGQVSGIIPTDAGYYIVKTHKVEQASQQTFEAVQDKIETRLRDDHYRKVTDDYLAKLFKDATISRTDEVIDAVTQRLINAFAK
jgi:parvulin-like peptidyl-prolyl isomerase